MAQLQQDNSHDTRRRLMEAALLAFAEKGFDGVGIREIALNAKANPAMIAYHFGGKEGLYEAALRWVISDYFKWLENLPDAPDPSSPGAQAVALTGLIANIRGLFENLTCLGDYHVRQSLHEAAHRLWSQELAAPRSAFIDFMLEHVNMVTERVVAYIRVLRPTLSKLELDATIFNIYGPIFFFNKHSNFTYKRHGREFSDDELEKLAQHFVDFCLRGLGVSDTLANEGA